MNQSTYPFLFYWHIKTIYWFEFIMTLSWADLLVNLLLNDKFIGCICALKQFHILLLSLTSTVQCPWHLHIRSKKYHNSIRTLIAHVLLLSSLFIYFHIFYRYNSLTLREACKIFVAEHGTELRQVQCVKKPYIESSYGFLSAIQ